MWPELLTRFDKNPNNKNNNNPRLSLAFHAEGKNHALTHLCACFEGHTKNLLNSLKNKFSSVKKVQNSVIRLPTAMGKAMAAKFSSWGPKICYSTTTVRKKPRGKPFRMGTGDFKQKGFLCTSCSAARNPITVNCRFVGVCYWARSLTWFRYLGPSWCAFGGQSSGSWTPGTQTTTEKLGKTWTCSPWLTTSTKSNKKFNVHRYPAQQLAVEVFFMF